MKKIFKTILCFTFLFSFTMFANASSPASFEYVGKDQVEQGETVKYELRIDMGDTFMVSGDETVWSFNIEYDPQIFEYVSFKSDMDGISCTDQISHCILQIPYSYTGPYNVGDVVGALTLKVLDKATIGTTTIKEPAKGEGTGAVIESKSVNVTAKTIVNDEKKDESIILSDNIKTYIVFGCIGIVVIVLLFVGINIVKNKIKK